MDCLELLEPAKILRNNQLGAPTQIPRVPRRGDVGLDRFVARSVRLGSRRPTERRRGTDRGKTVTKPSALSRLELPLSEKQIPQVVENLEDGDKPKRSFGAGRYAPKAGVLPFINDQYP